MTDDVLADKFVAQMMVDWRKLELSPLNMALCEMAEKLTQNPASMNESDMLALRAHGLDDVAIHDAVQTVSYFNYINRIADALGVEPEEGLHA